MILQLFPTGRPLSSRWRLLVWLTIADGAMAFAAAALGVVPEFPVNFPGVEHPLQLITPSTAAALENWTGGANAILFGACAVEIVLRYRRSSGDERAQLKWFAAASVIAAVGFAIGIVTIQSGPAVVFALLTPLVPLAAGVAILNYHLYDIDVVISKAVLFALLACVHRGGLRRDRRRDRDGARKHDEPGALVGGNRRGRGRSSNRFARACSDSRTGSSTGNEPLRTR